MSQSVSFEMKKFGRTLTDRLDGKKAYQEITANGHFPSLLDFSGVMSLGSSFGDEVLPKLAQHHSNKISVKNTSPAVMSCIKKIIEDSGIEVISLD